MRIESRFRDVDVGLGDRERDVNEEEDEGGGKERVTPCAAKDKGGSE